MSRFDLLEVPAQQHWPYVRKSHAYVVVFATYSHVLRLPRSFLPLPCPLPSISPDLGIYQGDPAAWHFPKVKTGTLDFTNPDKPGEVGYWDATFAAPWFLLLTSMTHYLAYATQFAVGSSYFDACQSGAMQVALPFLLVAGPMFQAMGGAGPNVMHEYEGFQVGTARTLLSSVG